MPISVTAQCLLNAQISGFLAARKKLTTPRSETMDGMGAYKAKRLFFVLTGKYNHVHILFY